MKSVCAAQALHSGVPPKRIAPSTLGVRRTTSELQADSFTMITEAEELVKSTHMDTQGSIEVHCRDRSCEGRPDHFIERSIGSGGMCRSLMSQRSATKGHYALLSRQRGHAKTLEYDGILTYRVQSTLQAMSQLVVPAESIWEVKAALIT